MTSHHPARFGRARLRATKRTALAAVAQHLLDPAAAPYRAGSWSGHGEPRGVRPLKRSGANLKRRASVQCVSANPNEVRVRGANVPPTPGLFSFFWCSLERNFASERGEDGRPRLGGRGPLIAFFSHSHSPLRGGGMRRPKVFPVQRPVLNCLAG